MSDDRNNITDTSACFPLGEVGGDMGGVSRGRTPGFVDDTFQDSAGNDTEGDGRRRYIGTTVNMRLVRVAFVVIVLSLLVVVARAVHVQIVRGDHYAGLAEGNRSRIEWVPSERGIIYDRNGVQLVGNVPVFSAAIVQSDLPPDESGRREIFGRLSEILEINPRDIEDELSGFDSRSSLGVHVAEDIGHEQAVLIDVMSATWPGVQLVKETRREYPFGERTLSLSHVIGFDGSVTVEDLESADIDYLPTDRIGRTGLERSYESELRGLYGRRRVEVDVLGRKKNIIAEEDGTPGKSLELTVDLEIQSKAEDILVAALRRYGKARGSVIVMKPDTGEILAMISEPAFDNNLFARGISTEDFALLTENENDPLFPRALGASLPSGSTFKLVVGAAALAEGVVTPTTTFMSSGGIAVSRWFFPDWKFGGHGLTDLAKAISESVNTYFYIIGGGFEDREGLGVARITEYAREFGLGNRTGIDLPGEGGGFLPSKEWKEEVKGERWYVGDTYHLAIGQGDILVTPLQISSMTSVFANGGELVRPRVVSAVTSRDGIREVRGVEIVNTQVVPAEHIAAVTKGMRHSVLYGSSRSLSLLPVSVAGKTGTAQWSSAKEPHAWFTSFAPYENPEIVVTVVIEEGGEGSVAAAPVARDIMAWYFGERE
ncbi:MAG: penicillin-binding protein 2 [Patescibacteria group bacterium]|nr:penicillin-binding protein 2 [Patescibacteria group bacterium]